MPVEAQSIRSLVVDDDKAIGEILKELILRDYNLVEVFSDGFEAIEFIRKQPVDIVITDLMMPRVGGLEVLHQAKITNPDVVVIIITGYASLDTAIEAVREGAYDYIKKPFKLQEMGIAFDNAVERVNLMRENRQLLQELKDSYDQLVAIKKERNECDDEDEEKRHRIARLNFFSDNLPGLHFFHNQQTDESNYFEQLHNIARLKKSGLLSEGEFTAFKAYLIKHLGNSTTLRTDD